MKNLILFSLIVCFSMSLLAQSTTDRDNFLNVKWETQKLGKGFTWYHFHFSEKQLFQSNQNIHYLKITKKGQRKHLFSFVSAGDSLVKTSEIAQQAGAIAAVNGSFFDVKNGGAVDLIKINGKILDSTRLDAKGRLTFHQKSALVILNNRVSFARQIDTNDVRWAENLGDQNIMVTGPLLIWESQNAPLSKIAFNDNRHPRTCACMTENDDLILLTVDGRTAQSQGLNLHELTFLLKTLRCRYAVNLDGGGSTTMYIAGQPENGVVNMPCDNKLFDHSGERKVSNIFVVKKNDH